MSSRTKKKFIESDTISRHLHCSICHEVFDDPVRTICGHTFCYICIEKWANINKKCPVCKVSIRQRKLEKDFIASLIIDDLIIQCQHFGCTWKGSHSIYKKHQRNCEKRAKREFIDPIYENVIVDTISDTQSDAVQDITAKKKQRV